MRNSKRLILAATVLLAAPAAAQNAANDMNATTANDAVAAPDAGLGTTNDAVATAPADGLTADPGATPATAAPAADDMAYAEPAPVEHHDRFPWGLLGLLGLAGLIPRKPRERADGDRR